MFEMDDIKLTFDDNVIDYIVERSDEYKLGARGLRSIVEAILMDAMFELPSKSKTKSKSFRVSLDYAQEKFNKASLAKLRPAV